MDELKESLNKMETRLINFHNQQLADLHNLKTEISRLDLTTSSGVCVDPVQVSGHKSPTSFSNPIIESEKEKVKTNCDWIEDLDIIDGYIFDVPYIEGWCEEAQSSVHPFNEDIWGVNTLKDDAQEIEKQEQVSQLKTRLHCEKKQKRRCI